MKSKTLTCITTTTLLPRKIIHSTELRCFMLTIVATISFAPRLMADLGSAKSFVVLSSGGSVTLQNRDAVTKATITGATTCPDAAGCTMRLGGSTILIGRGNSTGADQVSGDLIARATASQGLNCSGLKPGTTAICLGNIASVAGACVTGGGGVSNSTDCAGGVNTTGTNVEVASLLPKAGPDAAAFSAFLAALPATQTLAAINVVLGDSATITANAGLNVVAVPSIVIGSGGTLTINGPSSAQIVINIGSVASPGVLTLSLSANVLLSGGITPDRVVFNVLGGGGQFVQLSNTIIFNGTILAPQQGLVLIDGATARPTIINGALLFGQNVSIGNNVNVNFYPLAQIVRFETASPLDVVDVTQLPPPPPRTDASVESDTFFPQPIIEGVAAQSSSQLTSQVSLPNSGSASIAATLSAPSGPSPVDPLQGGPIFNGLSNSNNGPSGRVPPDIQIAVGQNAIVEMVNQVLGVYDKNGNLLQFRNNNGVISNAIFDLGRQFNTTAHHGTDPRVLYDAASQHFIAVYELEPNLGDTIRLEVAGDPTIINGVLQPWNWTPFDVATNQVQPSSPQQPFICFDQPKLGFSSDKVMISWNDYKTTDCGDEPAAKFIGAEYVVIDKANLLANTLQQNRWGPDSSQFQIVPVQSLSPTTTQYAAYHPLIADPAGQPPTNTTFTVMAFTGSVGSNISFSEQPVAIRTTPDPPAAIQPSGGNPVIQTNDTRLLTAVWQNNNLWATMNEGCFVLSDSTLHSCGRIVEFSTTSSTVLQDLDLQLSEGSTLGAPGADVYYPAIMLNSNDGVFIGFSFSNKDFSPGAGVFASPNGDLVFHGTGATFQSGTAVYNVKNSSGFINRWGDYSGAAIDPSDPNVVWMAQEYSAGDWATSIARIFFGP